MPLNPNHPSIHPSCQGQCICQWVIRSDHLSTRVVLSHPQRRPLSVTGLNTDHLSLLGDSGWLCWRCHQLSLSHISISHPVTVPELWKKNLDFTNRTLKFENKPNLTFSLTCIGEVADIFIGSLCHLACKSVSVRVIAYSIIREYESSLEMQ